MESLPGTDGARRLMMTAGAVLVAVMLAGCGGSSAADEGKADGGPTILEAAYEECSGQLGDALAEADMDDADPEEFIALGDEGRSLTLENSIEGTFGLLLSTASGQCVLNETDAPDSVAQEMSQTSAIMGRQEAKWDDLIVTYSFNANTGLQAVFTVHE